MESTFDWNFDGGVIILRSHATNNMHLTRDDIYQYYYCFDFPKHSYLTQTFDRLILNYLGGGFVQRWDNIIKERSKQVVVPYIHQKLKLHHFSGSFLCAAAGYSIAICVLFGEKLYEWYEIAKKRRDWKRGIRRN